MRGAMDEGRIMVRCRNNFEARRLPLWLRKRYANSATIHGIKRDLRRLGLGTVCEEAHCPNLGECFGQGTATIMIMGKVCTRRCGFCAVKGGRPLPLDPGEPVRVAKQIAHMGLAHAVITSVARDDLPDGGAAHFSKTIEEIRRLCPNTTVEVLTPDFEGREKDIRTVCNAGPDVFNHNIETVERLAPLVRSKAGYRRSLAVLSGARRCLDRGSIKSGLMVGLGETMAEVEQALSDLKSAGCDMATIGQYLRPSKGAIPVAEYIEPEMFRKYEETGMGLGFRSLLAGPFVRSSYLADKVFV